MKNYLFICGLVFVGILATPPTSAQVIFEDDFESYTDDASLNAVWAGGPATLDSGLAFSGTNSALHPGATVNSLAAGIGTASPSATQNLVLTGRIYDDAVIGNDRITIGLRGGPFPLFEMGRYNAFDVQSSAVFDVYGVRVNTIGNGIATPGVAPTQGWVAFADEVGDGFASTEGWHTYVATFSLTGLTVTVDFTSNGTIDSTLSYVGDGSGYGGGFTDLRFGGPSNLASAGDGANFDDIKLELVDISGGGLTCDFDADGDCDQTDINTLYGTSPTSSDIDAWLAAASVPANTALIDPNDILVLGDLDFDGDVNSTDLGLLLNNFGDTSSQTWMGGNVNADANVDSTDLGLLLNNFGSTSQSAAAVPEPSSLGLIALAVLGLAVPRRRNR